MFKSLEFTAKIPNTEFQFCHLLAEWHGRNYLNFLSLSFLICKTKKKKGNDSTYLRVVGSIKFTDTHEDLEYFLVFSNHTLNISCCDCGGC